MDDVTDELVDLLRASHAVDRGESIPPELFLRLMRLQLPRHDPPKRARYIFRREGKGWVVGEVDAPVFIQTRKKGFGMVHTLLFNPHNPVAAAWLHANCASAEENQFTGLDEEQLSITLSAENLNINTNTPIAVIDQQAISEIKTEIQRIDDILDDEMLPDDEREELYSRKEELTEYLVTSLGKGGPRKFNDNSEQARKNVQKLVKAALDTIVNQSPAVGRHLVKAVSTGATVCYSPDITNPPEWELH